MKLSAVMLGRQMSVAGGVVIVKDLEPVCLIMGLLRRFHGLESFLLWRLGWDEDDFFAEVELERRRRRKYVSKIDTDNIVTSAKQKTTLI